MSTPSITSIMSMSLAACSLRLAAFRVELCLKHQTGGGRRTAEGGCATHAEGGFEDEDDDEDEDEEGGLVTEAAKNRPILGGIGAFLHCVSNP